MWKKQYKGLETDRECRVVARVFRQARPNETVRRITIKGEPHFRGCEIARKCHLLKKRNLGNMPHLQLGGFRSHQVLETGFPGSCSFPGFPPDRLPGLVGRSQAFVR
jgi:hypothetical protein